MPYTTDQYEGLLAETVTIAGHGGDPVRAYFARPLGEGPFPSVVLIHHAPGWDQWYKETTVRFARRGYAAICPNLYERLGHGAAEDVGAMVRNAGGVPDDQVVGDLEASTRYVRALPYTTDRVGVFGSCSGGRHAYLVACRTKTPEGRVDAVVDLWGGGVVMRPEDLTEKRPVAPIDYTADLDVPLLGIFGNDDGSPSPEQVDTHEAELKRQGKDYEFHRYDGAGHGFFYQERPNYRQEQAVDAWRKVWAFLGKHLA
ncbi:MAG: dienelactone hydrolase family protein [Dehalococcoidia bacterium]